MRFRPDRTHRPVMRMHPQSCHVPLHRPSSSGFTVGPIGATELPPATEMMADSKDSKPTSQAISSCLVRDRDGLDLDQPLGGCERRDTDEGAGRRLHAFEKGRACLADDRAQFWLVVHDEGRDLYRIGV